MGICTKLQLSHFYLEVQTKFPDPRPSHYFDTMITVHGKYSPLIVTYLFRVHSSISVCRVYVSHIAIDTSDMLHVCYLVKGSHSG